MCLAIPLRIAEISGKDGVGEANGLRRKIRLDFIREPKIGDYVIVHAGFAIERLDPSQAEQSLAAAREVEAALQEVRDALAQS